MEIEVGDFRSWAFSLGVRYGGYASVDSGQCTVPASGKGLVQMGAQVLEN